MSVARLQESIRRCKTPVALLLDPREDRLDQKFLKNFTDMYGDCPMAHAEALRFHGSQTIAQAAKSVHKRIRQVEYRTQAPDHPILWAADESYYLKFYIFQVCEEK